jgi:hypothetical protein
MPALKTRSGHPAAGALALGLLLLASSLAGQDSATAAGDTARVGASDGTARILPPPERNGPLPTIGPPQDSTALMAPTEEPSPAQASRFQGVGADWTGRIDAHRAGIDDGSVSSTVGGPLLDSLAAVIDAVETGLATALRARDANVSGPVDSELLTLHRARESLLVVLDDTTRARLFAFGADGARAVGQELRFFWLHSRHETVAMGSTTRGVVAQFLAAPLGWIPEFLKIALALLLFLWWRGTGAEALVRWRRRLLEIRPIRRQNLRLAKSLWYFDRIRVPLEWLVLLTAIVTVTPARDFGPALFVWAVAKWILIGWTAVLLVDAMAARSAAGRRGESGLRRRSLWILCWWIVAYGLGRQLVHDFFGPGALFHWVTAILLVLLGLVVIVLVSWWREEVPERLDTLAQRPRFLDALLTHRSGLRSYLTSFLGGCYLLFDGTRGTIVRVLARSDLGRRTLAHLTRSELAKQALKEEGAIEGEALPDPVRQALLDGDRATLIDKATRKTVAELVRLLESGAGTTAALVGERGSGKSSTVRRVMEKLDRKAMLVQCPFGSYDELARIIADRLQVPWDSETGRLAEALRSSDTDMVIVDDVHRLARPVIGGVVEIDRLRSLIRDTGDDVSWMLTLDSAAWEYVRRFRETEPVHNHVLKLEEWGEEEIGRLVEARTKAAGVEPDFEKLVLPRQLDDSSYDSLASRNKAGFYRILWDDSGGNPEAALRIWADSLLVDSSGAEVVRLAHPPKAADLEGQSSTAFFVLRTLLRLETATAEDVVACLPISFEEIEDTLLFLRTKGIVEEYDGRLSVGWTWDRAVRRALSRRNMTA